MASGSVAPPCLPVCPPSPQTVLWSYFLNFSAESASGWGYAVFGVVSAGTEVVDAIEKVRTGNKSGHGDVPMDAVLIEKAVEIV